MLKTTKRRPPALRAEASPTAYRSAIVYLPIASIIPDPNNPRKHSRQQIRAIARSIEKFGFVVPIGVDRNNKVVFGHGRLEAAQLRGLKEVPVVRLDHLTEQQAKALMLADNSWRSARAGIMANWRSS
jgi:ParB/RepB/Spo0J family partition protein